LDTFDKNQIIQKSTEILTNADNPIWYVLLFLLLFFLLAIYVSKNVVLPMRTRFLEQKSKLQIKNLRLNSHFALLNPSPLFTIKSNEKIEPINESAIKLIEENSEIFNELNKIFTLWDFNLSEIIKGNKIHSFSDQISGKYYKIFLRGDSVLNYAQLYLNDVTELKNTQLELANSKAELQLLTKYNLAKIEEERKKIAMELHDTVGNNFALLRLYMNPQNINQEKSDLEMANNLLDDLIKEIKEISYSLNPSILQRHGIASAINSIIKRFNEANSIHGELNVSGDLCRYNETFEINIFRVVQESISNILKHSKAKNYQVEIKFFPERFELIIEDDGIGIPLEQLKNRKENHMGLLNMEERIRTLGGDLTIETKINDGTKIHIKVNTDGAANV